MLEWLKGRDLNEAGTMLARYAAQVLAVPEQRGSRQSKGDRGQRIAAFLRLIDQEAHPLALNFFGRARLANTFKWRMLENGVEPNLADELTSMLVVHLTAPKPATRKAEDRGAQKGAPDPQVVRELYERANAHLAQGRYAQAIPLYQKLIQLDPDIPEVLNNLASALCLIGQFKVAEPYLRRAIELQPDFPEAHNNLGFALRSLGRFEQAELSIRRALKSKSIALDSNSNMGITLMHLGRTQEAKAHFEKVLKVDRENQNALIGMAHLAKLEGRFLEAEATYGQVLERNPDVPGAMASLPALRKMTTSDVQWLQRAEQLAASGIEATQEAELRFAIGKYHDDVGEYDRAFRAYKRANELEKTTAEPYKRDQHAAFVDDLIRIYTAEVLAQFKGGGHASDKPILVVGMPRSGTSLVEQIIASHPRAAGAGELGYWTELLFERESAIRRGALDTRARKEIAASYLRVLDQRGGRAPRVVDKAPVNADYLGLIRSVFPNARILYLQRDPIDTCLSCYFQHFSQALSWAMDLSDIAHYYRQHQRLMQHWRTVLPREALLEVPYEELVADQESWTRRILDFLGLEWDPRCLQFHETRRTVATASAWQVRQKIYQRSVGRWQNYERHIAPLLALGHTNA